MSRPEELYYIAAAGLWAMLLALPVWGSPWWLLVTAPWLAIGYEFTTRSRSRGWLADLAFLATAPIHWVLER